jgi:hypothetical protein
MFESVTFYYIIFIILMTVFKGVFISWEVEATIISVTFYIVFTYSLLTKSVISFKIII